MLLTQDPKNRAQSDDDVWLEQALVLAASELSAFRSSAQGERDRLQREHDSVRARVQALEEQLRQTEQRHAIEITEARSLLDLQLNERAKAWADFSRELKQRIAAVSGIKLQHQRDLEDAANLRKQVHDLRLSLEAAQGTHAELETRLAASEESYAVAAETMDRAREEAAEAIAQRETLRVELTASAGHCAELQANRQVQTRKLD
ncbi:MAG TPA: hypothetical protein VHZ95_23065, partial [Polyangiales bacterium]|nr:hypothetical protein [Polyangiales bacterium]